MQVSEYDRYLIKSFDNILPTLRTKDIFFHAWGGDLPWEYFFWKTIPLRSTDLSYFLGVFFQYVSQFITLIISDHMSMNIVCLFSFKLLLNTE